MTEGIQHTRNPQSAFRMELSVKHVFVVVGVLLAITGDPSPAHAAGCIKGAIAGGVAGHYAGGHPYVGALGGCIVGRRLAAQRAARARDVAAQNRATNNGAALQPQSPRSTYTGGAYTRGGPVTSGAAGPAAPQYAPNNTPGYTGGAYQR